VPLSKSTARALAEAWEAQGRLQADELVFPSERGTVLDSSNLMSRVLKKAGRRAGVPWVGFHTFRHTCSTMLFRSGLNA
jgi:integrase